MKYYGYRCQYHRTATTGDSDYTGISSETLTFTGTAGETQTFTLTPTSDSKLEPMKRSASG